MKDLSIDEWHDIYVQTRKSSKITELESKIKRLKKLGSHPKYIEKLEEKLAMSQLESPNL